MNRSDLKNEWEHRMANFMTSGQSASKWCTANDISIHQFWYWKKRLKATQEPTSDSSKWLALEMNDSIENSKSKLVVKVGQASLEVEHGFDPKLLGDVIRTLQSLC
ncbi:IS66 family insertion sequence element accessory protein TnpB [Metabacillus halosaccharovorans]|uniref:IS66 family insertion sequence element accessory protein TnpA n=1 Tax=Metabacillus halosaccharovorans TaxID=930124 RepID=UPI0034CE4F48